eukprot:scaffold1930_cov346-Prasinococcus_capsulatus_cf.AAC.5
MAERSASSMDNPESFAIEELTQVRTQRVRKTQRATERRLRRAAGSCGPRLEPPRGGGRASGRGAADAGGGATSRACLRCALCSSMQHLTSSLTGAPCYVVGQGARPQRGGLQGVHDGALRARVGADALSQGGRRAARRARDRAADRAAAARERA